MMEKCKWTEDEWDGYWQTDCGQAWEFTDGGPAENHCRFCHYCGKPIEVVAFVAGERARLKCCKICSYWKPTTDEAIDGECYVTGNRTYPDSWCEDFE